MRTYTYHTRFILRRHLNQALTDSFKLEVAPLTTQDEDSRFAHQLWILRTVSDKQGERTVQFWLDKPERGGDVGFWGPSSLGGSPYSSAVIDHTALDLIVITSK